MPAHITGRLGDGVASGSGAIGAVSGIETCASTFDPPRSGLASGGLAGDPESGESVPTTMSRGWQLQLSAATQNATAMSAARVMVQ
jgi:hypothetical protein